LGLAFVVVVVVVLVVVAERAGVKMGIGGAGVEDGRK